MTKDIAGTDRTERRISQEPAVKPQATSAELSPPALSAAEMSAQTRTHLDHQLQYLVYSTQYIIN